jgi:hypothetical protein
VTRFLSMLAGVAVVATLAAGSGTASTTTRQFASNAGSASVSANWSGYSLQDITGAGLQFTSITGTWTVPVTKCEIGTTASAAFWVGLGGSSDTSTGLEQTGTGADCSGSSTVPRYFAWYEILPAASVQVPLKVKAGDQITTSVNVNGTNVLVQIKDRTRKTSFTRSLTVQAPDVTSAEWIAEAPSACDSGGVRCTVLPLANFGNVAFTRAAAIASSHPGTISDPTWGNEPITLVPQSSRFFAARDSSTTAGAVPGALSADGRSFPVAWVADATPAP